MYKTKILTTVTIKKQWLDEIKEHIPGIEFDIERTTTPLKVYKNPQTNTNYAVWDYFRTLFPATGYRYRVYVMSDKERLAYGMTDHLAAYNNQDRDGTLDFYMTATEKNLTKAKKNGFKYNFARIFVHETTHGKEQEQSREYMALTNPDRTHDWEAQGRLKELAQEHFKLSLLQQLLELTKIFLGLLPPSTLLHPIPKEYQAYISQSYGVPNSWYPATKHHIGTDYATPPGTRILAPWHGKTSEVGYTATLGNYCVYEFNFVGKTYAMRVLHLENMPTRGEFKRGAIIGYSGNTGQSTGAHCHIDVWHDKVQLAGITASNFRQRTVDPELLFNTKI